MRFLQSNDRKFLLFRMKPYQYYVFKLIRSARNKYIYSREYLSATLRYELCGFQGVQAHVHDSTITTGGFVDRPHTLFKKLKPTSFNLFHLFMRRAKTSQPDKRASNLFSHITWKFPNLKI